MQSGRDVTLQLFSNPEDVGRLDLPRQVLKQSMRWDEEAFGREYDLDILNLVCVNNFNAGAMENKGLLIFNCDGFLADPQTTTGESVACARVFLFAATANKAAFFLCYGL